MAALDRNGGSLALDFVNTVYWRNTNKRKEWLRDSADLFAWVELVCGAKPSIPDQFDRRVPERPSFYSDAILLRETLYSLFEAVAKNRPPPDEDWQLFNDSLAVAMARTRLHSSRTGFEWGFEPVEPLRSFHYPILKDAADLLVSPELMRLNICANPQCGWLFLDRTKNRSKKFCCQNPCANRAKARRHYLRATQNKSKN